MFFLKNGLIANFLIASFWLNPLATSANDNKSTSSQNSYNPPAERKIDQKRTVGSGSRGSCQSLFQKGSLTLLVPETRVVHYTTRSQPSFYLYAQATSDIPLKFNLVIPDPTAKNPIAEGTLVIEQAGLYEIKLTADVKLETGQIYLLQVGIPCSNEPEQIDQVLRAAVQKVPVSAQLSTQLELANSPLEKAQSYASSGIWYDAISLGIKQAQTSSESTNYVQQLIQEVGISLERRYFSSYLE